MRQSDFKALQSLEAKISSTILPIKERLSNKLQEAQREMQAAMIMQARNPLEPLQSQQHMYPSSASFSKLVPCTSPSNPEILVSKSTSSLVPRADATYGDSNSASILSVATSREVQSAPLLDTRNAVTAVPAAAEGKKKRKRQTKKDATKEGSTDDKATKSSVSSSNNRVAGTSGNSPNGISESLSIMNCFNNSFGGCTDDFGDIYGGDDNDMYLYDLCLGHEDLDLGAIEADDMFSSPDDNHTYLPDTTSNANNKNLDVGNDKTSKSKENFNNYLATSSSNDESGSNMSMRVSAPDEYISPKLRRRLNQIVPNPRHPRTVEYQCSCCSSTYPMTVQENPWWAVFIHECPQCKSNQVPRFDINSSTNAIELDPNIVALYGEGVDDDDDCALDDDEDDDEGDEVGADQPEEECFGVDGCLDHDEASKLLVLMCHSRTCTGIHASQKHADICKSTKFLMLHIRDCNGIDIYGNDCKFSWCMPCKRMLQHLTRCQEPAKCAICNPFTLPESFQQLQALNRHRSEVTTNKSMNASSMQEEATGDAVAAVPLTCAVVA